MKRILPIAFALASALLPTTVSAGIVSNSQDTAADSLAVTFSLFDSLGNPVVAESGDSAWMFFWYPGGELAHVDSARIVTDNQISERRIGPGTLDLALYTYHNSIASIDGAGVPGTYKYTVIAFDSSLSLATTSAGEFQLFPTSSFSTYADSVLTAVTTVLDGTAAGQTRDSVSRLITDSNLARYVTRTDYHSTATGSGAFPCTVQVATISAGDTIALSGVFLRVYNSDETATAAIGTTDANGRTVFGLDADTFHVYGYQGGYVFSPQPETVVVSTSGVTDTLWAVAFDPGAPVAPDLCRVYGWITDLANNNIKGARVLARITASPLRYQNTIISPYQVSTTSDSTGYWSLDLFPSADLDPNSTTYEFEVRFGSGAILRRKVVVPDTTQWQFSW